MIPVLRLIAKSATHRKRGKKRAKIKMTFPKLSRLVKEKDPEYRNNLHRRKLKRWKKSSKSKESISNDTDYQLNVRLVLILKKKNVFNLQLIY